MDMKTSNHNVASPEGIINAKNLASREEVLHTALR